MNEKERTTVAAVAAFLESQSEEVGCWCGKDTCTIEEPDCGARQQQRAIRDLRQLIEPPVATRHPERLSNLAERIYFEAAQKLGQRNPGINHGFSTLEFILSPSQTPSPATAAEAEVVGTVLQWLGTNCGRCFIDEVEKRIREQRAERSLWRVEWFNFLEPRKGDSCDRFAESVLGDDFPEPTARQRIILARAVRQLLLILALRMGETTSADAAKKLGLTSEQFMRMFDRATEMAKQLARPDLEDATAA